MSAAFDPMRPPPFSQMKTDWAWIAAETAPSMASSLGSFPVFDDQEALNPGADMPWQVDMERLFEFVREQADSVNNTPVPDDVRATSGSAKDVQALWMAAGLASLGLAIVDHPDRFIHELPDKRQLLLEMVSAPKAAQS